MGVQPNQGTYDDPPPGSSDRKRKRRHTAAPFPTNVSPAALLRDEDDDEASDRVVRNAKKPKKPKKASIAAPAAEKRLRRFRPSAPSSFHAVYERATSQRFFLLSRTRCGTPDCPEELFELTGSTGNVYRVHIQKQPTCSCPHASAGNQCKHIVWALKSVLRAPYALVFQLALLSTELRDIFANAPAPADESGAGPDKDKNRKPVDGDCPICFEEMQSGDGKEPLVWCRAACGQNIHRQCFEMWAATKKTGNGTGTSGVPCPYCRSAWETDNDMKLKNIITSGAPNADGYVNVADQLGISTERDCSTYSTWWTGHSGYRGRR
ncbi:SWIM zinc finger protein [Diaporthe amygdali]|uniref:SWIM zinc finger protein n=1 Tax=Phomopsis amygdali TaxID=1214568 RepID=UPI0022FDCB2C|nr:SWIM zinc finger protein [Diaporthe amygdali]KAJ0124022.1 SWIM zinc finger protein [Diaporthe amygdali]